MAYERALAALSDPTRREIFERVLAAPRSAGEIGQGLPISQPAVSQHLRVLKQAGLIAERREGTRRLYSADARALGELRDYVDAMWKSALERFSEAAANSEQAE